MSTTTEGPLKPSRPGLHLDGQQSDGSTQGVAPGVLRGRVSRRAGQRPRGPGGERRSVRGTAPAPWIPAPAVWPKGETGEGMPYCLLTPSTFLFSKNTRQ